jgi:hypothetical protein
MGILVHCITDYKKSYGVHFLIHFQVLSVNCRKQTIPDTAPDIKEQAAVLLWILQQS